MNISIQAIDLPFRLGSKVWINPAPGSYTNTYQSGEVIGIQLESFSLYKSNATVLTDKLAYTLEMTRVSCRVALYPDLITVETYDYWLDGANSTIFLSEEDLLTYRRINSIFL